MVSEIPVLKFTTKDRVRSAALSLFALRGYEATGIRDIANEAGISVASLYNYMSTKEDLLISIMEEGLVQIRDVALRTLKDQSDPIDQLVALVRLHVWRHANRRQSAVVVDTEIRSLSREGLTHIVSLRDEYENIWREVIRRGMLDGSFDVLEPKLVSLALLEMCTGVSHWFSSKGELSLSYVGDVFADAALGMTRAKRNDKPVRVSDISPMDLEAIFLELGKFNSTDERKAKSTS